VSFELRDRVSVIPIVSHWFPFFHGDETGATLDLGLSSKQAGGSAADHSFHSSASDQPGQLSQIRGGARSATNPLLGSATKDRMIHRDNPRASLSTVRERERASQKVSCGTMTGSVAMRLIGDA
jgi:hypothetical protein